MGSFERQKKSTEEYLSNSQNLASHSSDLIIERSFITDSHDDHSAIMRTRSNTVTSSMSFYDASTSDSSCGAPSRPTSQHDYNGLPHSGLERRGTGARAILAKGGRALRKHASKLSLSAPYFREGESPEDDRHRPKTAREILKHAMEDGSLSNKRDAIKLTISEPFAFQHVTHTDRAYLDSLHRVPKTELVSEFSALRAGQKAKPELRGIRVDDLPPTKPLPDTFQDLSPTTPTKQAKPARAETLSRPMPPPKDDALAQPTSSNVRQSRSVENYSRPVSIALLSTNTQQVRYSSRKRSLPLSTQPPQTPYYEAAQENDVYATGSFIETTVDEAFCSGSHGKPLPHLPFVIHAISTSDDTARPLRTTPLPKIPFALEEMPEEDDYGRPRGYVHLKGTPRQRSSLRHVQSCPTTSKIHQHFIDPTVKENPLQPKIRVSDPSPTSLFPRSESLVADHRQSTATIEQEDKRISVGLKPISINDWEDAIDYSWATAVEPESQPDSPPVPSKFLNELNVLPHTIPNMPLKPELTTLVIPTTTFEDVNRVSAEVKELRAQAGPAVQPSASLTLTTSKTVEKAATHCEFGPPVRMGSSPLLGLGINTLPPSGPFITRLSDVVVNDQVTRDLPGDAERNQIKSFGSDTTSCSIITKSSSQESIIFSIASSIMGTQRSSNSTSSLVDITTANTSVDHSPRTTVFDEWKEPLETLQEHPTDKMLPAEPRVVREIASSQPSLLPLKSSDSHKRAQSLANDFVVRDQTTPTTDCMQFRSTVSQSASQKCTVHVRQASGSRIPIPVRSSSIKIETETESPPVGRRMRSATTVSKPRHISRASYSLFPDTPPVPTM